MVAHRRRARVASNRWRRLRSAPDHQLRCSTCSTTFPTRQFDPANIASYNAAIGDEFERIRDFTVLHYRLSRRDELGVLAAVRRTLALPDTLAQRIDMYRATGRIVAAAPELFGDLDWFWILEGMGVIPRDYDPLVGHRRFRAGQTR